MNATAVDPLVDALVSEVTLTSTLSGYLFETGPDGAPKLVLFREFHLYIVLALYLLFARFISYFFYLVKIPRLVGDIFAGCLLGPTILPQLTQLVAPDPMRQTIRVLGDLGLIFASFVAGVSFDRRLLRGQYLRCLGFTLVNCGVPTVLAIPLYYVLPAEWKAGNEAAFFCVLAMLMMTTALPFCFLILEELDVKDHPLGKFILAFSFTTTLVYFTALSVGTSLAVDHPWGSGGLIAFRVGMVVVFLAGCMAIHFAWNYLIAHCHGRWIFSWPSRVSTDLLIFVLAGAILSGVATQRLESSLIPGAFMWGASLPFDDAIRSTVANKVKWVSRWIFMPYYFLAVGTSFDLRTLTLASIPYVLLVTACSVIFKFATVPFAKFLFGLSWRDSFFCATLADTRGFAVLVAGTSAINVGVFGEDMFSACVLITLITNFLAGPLGRAFKPLPVSDDDDDSTCSDAGGDACVSSKKDPTESVAACDVADADQCVDDLAQQTQRDLAICAGLTPSGGGDSFKRPPGGRHRSATCHTGPGGEASSRRLPSGGSRRQPSVGYVLPGEPPLTAIPADEEALAPVVPITRIVTHTLFAEDVIGRFAFHVATVKSIPYSSSVGWVNPSKPFGPAAPDDVHVQVGDAGSGAGAAGSGGGGADPPTPPRLPMSVTLSRPDEPVALPPVAPPNSFVILMPDGQCLAIPAITFTGAELLAWLALGEVVTGTHALDCPTARLRFAERCVPMRLIRPVATPATLAAHTAADSATLPTVMPPMLAGAVGHGPAGEFTFHAEADYVVSPLVQRVLPPRLGRAGAAAGVLGSGAVGRSGDLGAAVSLRALEPVLSAPHEPYFVDLVPAAAAGGGGAPAHSAAHAYGPRAARRPASTGP